MYYWWLFQAAQFFESCPTACYVMKFLWSAMKIIPVGHAHLKSMTLGTWINVLQMAPPLNTSSLCVWGHGVQGTTSNITPQVSSTFLILGQSPIGLELVKQARLTDQQGPVIHLSLPPWCWTWKCKPPFRYPLLGFKVFQYVFLGGGGT